MECEALQRMTIQTQQHRRAGGAAVPQKIMRGCHPSKYTKHLNATFMQDYCVTVGGKVVRLTISPCSLMIDTGVITLVLALGPVHMYCTRVVCIVCLIQTTLDSDCTRTHALSEFWGKR